MLIAMPGRITLIPMMGITGGIMNFIAVVSFVFICSWLPVAVVSAADKNQLTICVHPYRSSTILYQSFSPLAEYFSQKLGQHYVARRDGIVHGGEGGRLEK